jgi:hypothetical protein
MDKPYEATARDPDGKRHPEEWVDGLEDRDVIHGS